MKGFSAVLYFYMFIPETECQVYLLKKRKKNKTYNNQSLLI